MSFGKGYQFHTDQGIDNIDGMDKFKNKLNNKKSTTDMTNSNHDSNTTTSMSLKKKLGDKKAYRQMSQDLTLTSQEYENNDTHNNAIYDQRHQQKNNTDPIQYLTHNAVDNCFGLPDMTRSSETTCGNTVVSEESATIVNIDIFDDQLSTSSLSNTSRFSCETAPLTTTTPPISLNGCIDTNLMHFSHTMGTTGTKAKTLSSSSSGGEDNKKSKTVEVLSKGHNSTSSTSSNNDHHQRPGYQRRREGRRGNNDGDDDEEDGEDDDDNDDDYDGNSSIGSGGSLNIFNNNNHHHHNQQQKQQKHSDNHQQQQQQQQQQQHQHMETTPQHSDQHAHIHQKHEMSSNSGNQSTNYNNHKVPLRSKRYEALLNQKLN
uniref:Uncharacterized protein n=1 Tax=Stomoxys calcitrans TaxID=35570 RepID=A0A1I8P4J9_STOCA